MLLEVKIFDHKEQSGSRSYDVNIEEGSTVGNLRNILSTKFPICVEFMKYKGHVLEDQCYLSSYNIVDRSEIIVNGINLNVEINAIQTNHKPVSIICENKTSTEALMELIRQKVNFDTSMAYLTHNGNPLQSGASLINQQIKDGDSIVVGIRMRGGY